MRERYMSESIRRFEDLIAWQKARNLTAKVYQVTRLAPFVKDYALCNQIQRAAVSVMANVAEGFERGKRTEFHQFLCIAKGSCGEVRSHLYVALDSGYLNSEGFQALSALANETSRIIGGLRSAVQLQRDQLSPK